MKTLKTQEIDGIKIIIGFQKRPICPKGTREKSEDLIKDLPEKLELNKKGNEAIEHVRKANEEGKKEIHFLKLNDKSQASTHGQNRRDRLGSAATCNSEMKEIQSRLVPKEKQILRDNSVYFEPRAGEVIKTESEIISFEEKFLARGLNEQLKVDGSFINDFRGVSYNKKISGTGIWGKTTINKIGFKIPTGGKLDADLTDTDKLEIEAGRVAGLSVEEKTAEKTNAVNGIMAESIKMRSGLEIKADPDALAKSQDFYNGEVAKIESKYK